jgi:hypothetical protein
MVHNCSASFSALPLGDVAIVNLQDRNRLPGVTRLTRLLKPADVPECNVNP